MDRLLYWITNYLPCRIINDGEREYLQRYYIGTLFGWTFYLHQFVGSDPERGLHCHPWRLAFSVILSGWYWEETVYGTSKVRWFNWLVGENKHRVVLPEVMQDHLVDVGQGHYRKVSAVPTGKTQPCWTLFFHRASNVKKWGFYHELIADDVPDGALIFEPYRYTREGNQAEWWTRAPTGREVREAVVRRNGGAA